MRQSIWRSVIAVSLGLIWVMMWADAYSADLYVIGGEDNPWSRAWLPEGSISLVDTTAGSIRPLFITPDENIALGYKERGGYVADRVLGALHRAGFKMFDGDLNTSFLQGRARPGEDPRGKVGRLPTIDLGGLFPLNRIVFYPAPNHPELFPDMFDLLVSDGSRGEPFRSMDQWTILRQGRENRDVVVETRFPTQFLRYVALQGYFSKDWEIAEMEIYGEGFAPATSYISSLIDFGDIVSWGEIRWSGRRDPAARVFIQTRSGKDADPDVYWWKTGQGDEVSHLKESGEPLTRKDYERLAVLQRGSITHDTDNWSFWSAPYDFEDGLDGVPIVSPGPRRYFQIRIDFTSGLTDGAEIDSILVQYSKPPAAQDAIAEIWPLNVRAGETTTFTYAIRPTIMSDNTGFDSLEILTLSRSDAVRAVKIDDVDVSLDVFPPEIYDDRFIVHFPKLDADDSFRLLEVEFDAVVLRYGTEFVGRVFDSETDEVPQQVNSGDATIDLPGNELSVRTSLEGSLITSVDVSPNPFTPNGDGINDVTDISYSFLRLTSPASVSVDVYDLSGRRVKQVYSGEDASGRYAQRWDGQGNDAVVPPGMYIYRISVDADEGESTVSGVVSVVY